jgi:two-component system CheB/CheR fusion protein
MAARSRPSSDLEGVDRRGRRILCRVTVSGLLDEHHGGHGLVLMFQDITEERLHEEYTRYLGRIMGQALNEIYFLDPQTLRFTLTNEGAGRSLAIPRRQLAQMALPDVLLGVTPEELGKAAGAGAERGSQKEIVFETSIRAADGREYPAEICMQHFSGEVPPILVALVHDTSDRSSCKTVERLDMAAHAAHSRLNFDR